MVKCISFDLWGTLIKGNPLYKSARTLIVANFVDSSRFTREDITKAFEMVKKDFDVLTEKYGIQFDSKDLYEHAFNLLDIPKEYRDGIRIALARAFVQTPPVIIPGTLEALEVLSRQYKIVLISNTLLVDGHILETALRPSGLWDTFEHLSFSSDVRFAKPSPNIFLNAYAAVGVAPHEVVHVGDNTRTDGFGIEQVGGTFRHINGTSDNTIKHIEKEYGHTILA